MIDGRRARKPADQEQARQGHRRVGERVSALGVRADHVTLLGLLIAGATAVALGSGRFLIGIALLIIAGLMDTLDGAVAKASGTASPRGAFFDSVADRVADLLIFGGLAWHFMVGPDPRLALLPVAIIAVASLISYERAKAESLGFQARGGLMERAERLILLGVALAFHVVLIPLLWVLLVLSGATALGRFTRVWRQASGAPARAGARWGSARVESRWRAFRESGNAQVRRDARSARRRARREVGPLSTRLRRVLGGPTAVGSRRAGRERSGRARSARALHRRLDAER